MPPPLPPAQTQPPNPAPLPPPPIPLAYAPPPGSLFRRHAAKFAALAAGVVSFAALFVSPDGSRLLAMCAVFPLVFAVLLRLFGPVTRVALWAAFLLAAGVGASLSGLLVYAMADSLNPPGAYTGDYVVLPTWPLPLALMAFLWLPALLLVLRRDAVHFEHAAARRDVVPFSIAIGVLFSTAHLLALVGGYAIGGYQAHVRTITSADSEYRAELYKSHWLGEAHFHLYLCKPSPAPMFGRRLRPNGPLETALTADLVASDDGSTLSVRADNAVVMEVDLDSGNTRRARTRRPGGGQNLRALPQ